MRCAKIYTDQIGVTLFEKIDPSVDRSRNLWYNTKAKQTSITKENIYE